MLRKYPLLCVTVLFLLNIFVLSNATLNYEWLKFKYNVTVSPVNGVDSEACYPPQKGGVSSVPCKSLGFALEFQYRSSIVFYLTDPNSTYYLNSNSESLTFSNGSDFVLIGANAFRQHQAVINCHGDNIGLSFVNFDNIVFDTVRLIHCGAWHDSTSLDLTTSQQQMLKIRAAIYFYNCTNVTMNNVQVINSSEAMGVVMYDVDGIVEVNGSNISTNMVNESSYGGGGFTVEFTYCMPGDNTCNRVNYDPNKPRRNKNALYKFSNCTFHNNVAHAQNRSTYGGYIMLSSNASHQAMGRGGGLSVFFKGDAFNNSFLFIDCEFSNNQAVDGAGLFLKMSDNAFANRLTIVGCHFHCNQAYFSKEFGTGGGGLSFSTRMYPWAHLESNVTLQSSIAIDKCSFTNNHALSGGGVLFSISRQFLQQLKIVVSNSSFESNKAEVGSALAQVLFSSFSHGRLPQVNIESCCFIKNSMSYANDTIHFIGIGAVYIRYLPTVFQGYINFTGNEGSALSVIGTLVDFTGSSVDFIQNTGLVGAGIALLACASVLVGENTILNFTGNHAKQYGGAIYNQDTGRDPEAYECFIRYSKPFESPECWNVSFTFINNSAGLLGDAIYATDILQCSHGFSDVHSMFCWDNWDYGDSNCTDQIFTMANTFNTTATTSNPVKIFPGHSALLPLESLDNFNHNVTLNSVYHAYISVNNKSQESIAKIEPGYAHVSSNYISITGQPEQNLTLVMQTESFPKLQVKLNLKITKCPPGFILYYGNLSNKSDSFCRCPKDNTENYLGLLKCLQKDFQSRIPARMWLGEVGAEKSLLMGAIPLAYSYTENDSFKNIPIDIEQLNDGICGPVHRMGDLCGECLPGYAVTVNSAKFECIPCNISSTQEFVRNLFSYVGLTYGPIFVLLLVIIFFNFKLASSATMGFILYAQMIGSGIFSLYPVVCTDCQERKIQTAYETIYGIFNLNSLASLMHPFCLNEHFGTLDVICLEYAIAGFPLVMIVSISLILRCTSRFQCRKVGSSNSKNNVHATPRNTLLHAFISFVLLSYTKFSLASTRTIVVSDLFDQTGETKQKRIFYAGHLMLNNSEFLLPYGLLAMFILILIVICPLLFLLGPLFIDWLMDQRGFGWLHQVWPSIKIHTYLDTFQGYYKPNRRIFSSTYFIFRIAIFFSYSFTTTFIQAYVVQQIAVTVLIVIVAIFRPYKKDYYNNVDILLFLNLAFLNALGIYISVNSDTYFSYRVYKIECILVWLPLIYIISYAVWNRLKKRQTYHKVKRKIRMINFVRSTPNESRSEEREELLHSREEASADGDSDEDLFRRAAKGNVYQCNATVQPRPAAVTTSTLSVPLTY